jgi:hypothetical protein
MGFWAKWHRPSSTAASLSHRFGGLNDWASARMSCVNFWLASRSDSGGLLAGLCGRNSCARAWLRCEPRRVNARGSRQGRQGCLVNLSDKFAVLAVVKSSMADIKQGTFMGTATVTQPVSSLRSQEAVVFPENLRGFVGGHYPWDLGSKSMMANATVANAVRALTVKASR